MGMLEMENLGDNKLQDNKYKQIFCRREHTNCQKQEDKQETLINIRKMFF